MQPNTANPTPNKLRRIIIGAGAVIVLASLVLAINNYFYKSDWINVTGTVESYTPDPSGRHYVRIAYVVDGQIYHYSRSDRGNITIGSARYLSYDPKHPENASLQHEQQYFIAVLLLIPGLLLIIGGKFAKYK